MSSQNKKKKDKNLFGSRGYGLKEKDGKLKRMLFFNASTRKKIKRFDIDENND